MALHDRLDALDLLHLWYYMTRLVDVDDLRDGLLLQAWSMPDYPCRSLYRREWLELFKATGFVSQDDSPPPGGARGLAGASRPNPRSSLDGR